MYFFLDSLFAVSFFLINDRRFIFARLSAFHNIFIFVNWRFLYVTDWIALFFVALLEPLSHFKSLLSHASTDLSL